jgi:hypothetical protein
MGKTFHWVTAYMDGETITIDKTKITFTLTESNPFPMAIMTENKEKNLLSPEEYIPKELKVSANSNDINNLLNEINYEGKPEI